MLWTTGYSLMEPQGIFTLSYLSRIVEDCMLTNAIDAAAPQHKAAKRLSSEEFVLIVKSQFLKVCVVQTLCKYKTQEDKNSLMFLNLLGVIDSII